VTKPPSKEGSQSCPCQCHNQSLVRPSHLIEKKLSTPTTHHRHEDDDEETNLAEFNTSLFRVLKHEGGYNNDPTDPGGETKYGISKRSYPHLNIKKISLDQASSIYFVDFWKKSKIEDIDCPELQHKLLDILIQFGVEGGIKLWKKALIQVTTDESKPSINIDKMDVKDLIDVTNGEDPLHVILELRMAMMNHYLLLVKKNPSLIKFLHGWLTRAHDDDGKKLSQKTQKT
jgi:lysozyme family protein